VTLKLHEELDVFRDKAFPPQDLTQVGFVFLETHVVTGLWGHLHTLRAVDTLARAQVPLPGDLDGTHDIVGTRPPQDWHGISQAGKQRQGNEDKHAHGRQRSPAERNSFS